LVAEEKVNLLLGELEDDLKALYSERLYGRIMGSSLKHEIVISVVGNNYHNFIHRASYAPFVRMSIKRGLRSINVDIE